MCTVCHSPGGASNSVLEKLIQLTKLSAGPGSCRLTWPSGPSWVKVLITTLSFSSWAEGLLTLRSVLTELPGLTLSRMGSGEMAAEKPGDETDWAWTGGARMPAIIIPSAAKVVNDLLRCFMP